MSHGKHSAKVKSGIIRASARSAPSAIRRRAAVIIAGAIGLQAATSWAATWTPANATDFTNALNNSALGDTIILQAGTTYTGSFTLPNKTTGLGYITIQSSALSSLPAGVRVFPADASNMPKIQPGSAFAPAIKTATSAHHFKLVGLEVIASTDDTTANTSPVIQLGTIGTAQDTLAEVPGNIIIDRCYIHAYSDIQYVKIGVTLNSASTDITNSYISGFKGLGQDTQAAAGSNGPGPFNLINNYFEGAGENVIFGGADPTIANLIPSDIVVKRNHFFKPLSWRVGDPSYAGIKWQVKNIFELKNAKRAVIEGNIFENNWLQAQDGTAILFTVRNQQGTAPWCTIEDVDFRDNIVRHTGSVFNILGSDNNHPSGVAKRINIENNLCYDVSGALWGGGGAFYTLQRESDGFVLNHNTTFHTGNVIGVNSTNGVSGLHTNFTATNNLQAHNAYGVIGASHGIGNDTLNYFFTNLTFTKNVLKGGSASLYNQYPNGFSPNSLGFPSSWSTVFVNQAAPGADFAGWKVLPAYQGQGTDGKDIGCDIDAVVGATAGCISGVWPGMNDTFESASATIGDDGNDAADVAWFTRLSQPTLSVVNDATFGSNVMHVDTTSKGQPVVGSFLAKTLTNIGDKITLTADVRVVGTSQSAGLRFGLFNDNGTPTTGDNQSTSDDDSGYFVSIGTPTSGVGGTQIRKETVNASQFFVTSTQLGTQLDSGLTPDQAVHSITLVIEKTGSSELTITGNWTGDTNGGSMVRTDSSGLVTTFNELAFGFGHLSGTPTIDYRVDNIRVQ